MINYSDKQADFILLPYDHALDVCEGTPRSGKTFAGTARFALHLIVSRDPVHLVVGFSQEQAFRLIIDGGGYGLMHIFGSDCALKHDPDRGDFLWVNTPGGEKQVFYKGGGKKDSRKAITGMSLGSVYFCEIDLLHPDMIQECFRRTFAARDRWHIADLNPPSPMHPVISDVFEVQDTRWTHWTLQDNPILTPERIEEIRQVCLRNPYLYKRDFEGQRSIPQGVIYDRFDPKRHVLAAPPDGAEAIEMYFTGDGGLTDATSIDCWVVARFKGKYRLYRMANYYHDGNLSMSQQARQIAREFIPYCRNLVQMRESDVQIDPACKALRMELELCGVQTSGADNNAHDIKGSRKGIDVGIEYLQNAITDGLFYLVEDDRYGVEAFLREVGLYVVDDHGVPVDAHNHQMDSARYGNNYFYKHYVL